MNTPPPRPLLRSLVPVAVIAGALLRAQSPLDLFQSPQGNAAPADYGVSLVLLDDLDGDGLRDPALACAGGAGRVDVRSSETGAILYTILPNTQSGLGIELAVIDDLDGDGFRDLIVGLPSHNNDTGLVLIYSGRTGKQLRSFGGWSAGDRFGAAVADAGDIDLDGTHDIAVGAPGWDLIPPFLIYGIDSGRFTIFSGSTGASLFNRNSAANSRFGSAIAALGDVDGDGRPSIAVGAPGISKVGVYEPLGDTATLELSSFTNTEFGAALGSVADLDGDGGRDVIVGQPGYQFGWHAQPGGRAAVFGSVTGTQLFAVASLVSGYQIGGDVADAGDFDLDGVPDIVVSGWGDAYPGGINGNTLFVSGATGVTATVESSGGGTFGFALAEDADGDGRADLWRSNALWGSFARRGDPRSPASALLAGHGFSGARFGESVALLDDLDGDGRPEVAVGGPHAFPTDDADQGAVRVYSDGAVLYSFDGAAGEQLGAVVVTLDDLDGDGKDEFAIGRPRRKFGQLPVGAVTVHAGATGAVLRTHFGVAFGDRYGAAIARVPDTDGDGVDDYAIGAPAVTPANGAVGAGRVSLYSGATGAHRYSIDGVRTRGAFGAALAGAEDVDGDGRGDLMIGAPGESTLPLGAGPGRVHRRSGQTGAVIDVLVGTQPAMRFGAALASVGDLNGDGACELLVGAPMYRVVERGDGRFELRDGATGAILAFDNGAFGSRLGAAVAGCGDVDNDGVLDYAVGEPRGVDVQIGRPGRVRLYSGATSTWYSVLAGAEDGARLGSAIDGGVDLDGDRRPDLVAGAADAHKTFTPAGNAGTVPTGNARTWTARALGSQAFGVGAPGCAGVQDLTLLRPARPGQSMEFRFSGVGPTMFPLLAVGDFTFPAGVPVLGALAHVNAGLTLGLPFPTGTHGAHLESLPNNPNLVGQHVHLQLFGFWFGACPAVPMGVSSSNGLTVTVQ